MLNASHHGDALHLLRVHTSLEYLYLYLCCPPPKSFDDRYVQQLSSMKEAPRR